MSHLSDGKGAAPVGGNADIAVRYYKKDFWRNENMKYDHPHYRMRKAAEL